MCSKYNGRLVGSRAGGYPLSEDAASALYLYTPPALPAVPSIQPFLLCPPFLLFSTGVQVQVGKPSYAQVCELEAVLVNGVDFTSLAVFQPARELGRFADPEGLRKVREAVLCVRGPRKVLGAYLHR